MAYVDAKSRSSLGCRHGWIQGPSDVPGLPSALSSAHWLCFGTSPRHAPGSPRLSPLGGVMASLTPAILASHPPISFNKTEPEFFPVAPTEVPRVTLIGLA